MSRSTEEWVATHDDQAIPSRVRLRVFNAHDGRCYLSGKRIMAGDAWDVDHKIALCNGGAHRETNLAPVLKDKHREKTKLDVAIKSKTDRIRQKHLGIFPKSKRKIQSRGFR